MNGITADRASVAQSEKVRHEVADSVGKPQIFLIVALAGAFLAFSVLLPPSGSGQTAKVRAAAQFHLEGVGTLGVINESGRNLPVIYPQGAELPKGAELILPANSGGREIFVGLVSGERGVNAKGMEYLKLEPAPFVNRHPVFASPRKFDGQAAYMVRNVERDGNTFK